MWGLRRQCNEIIAAGHVDAHHYPLAYLWEELALSNERQNRMLANEATVMHAAINCGISAFGKGGNGKAVKHFTRLVNGLLGQGVKKEVLSDGATRHRNSDQGPRRGQRQRQEDFGQPEEDRG